ncbi:MAG: hypothetical protein U0984_11935 [Prosthecobacter sp.]|nr:hypothetical protein [Prosthecobacter sp.]
MVHFPNMATSAQESLTAEERDAALVEKLRLQGVKVKSQNAWKKRIGWAKDSSEHAEAMRLGAEWREEVNRQSIKDLDGCS